jgi:hypothetical protein
MKILGPYTTGEKPAPLEVQFADAAGQPITITGWTARWRYRKPDGTEVERTANVSDGPDGRTTYTWVEADLLTVGDYYAQMWVGDGMTRLASVPFKYTVDEAVAGVATV